MSGATARFSEGAVGNLACTEPAVFQALARIGAKNRIATTNYDNLLCAELKWQPVTWKNSLTAAECTERQAS